MIGGSKKRPRDDSQTRLSETEVQVKDQSSLSSVYSIVPVSSPTVVDY